MRVPQRISIGLLMLMILIVTHVNGAIRKKLVNIRMDELKDKIAGAWIGQIIGNIYGLPHENKYINAPGPENWPFGYNRNLDKLKLHNGAFSDDDTDIEYMYLLQMEKYGYEPTYGQLKAAWTHHVRDRVWLANRAALGLMNFGFTPPFTGKKEINPHWYQIDPQLINEIWAYTAPGMVGYASAKSDWAGRITSDDWGVEPTIHYGAMYAAAFFENDIRKLIDIGLKELPANSRYAHTVREMILLHEQHPNNWKASWKVMAQQYYLEEPDVTKTIWNANLNGACAILAMLYGKGDFQKTLDLSCAMGFDADNQAATLAGLLGIVHGLKGIPKELYLPVEGWTKPFNDRYINITRHDLSDESISKIIDKTLKVCLDLVIAHGGKVSGKDGHKVVSINTQATFKAPVEFYIGPLPVIEVNKSFDYSFNPLSDSNNHWKLIEGVLPEGVIFNNGRIFGTPKKPGHFPVKIHIHNSNTTATREYNLLVRNTNIAPEADSIITNIRVLNESVLDSCWYTFGKSLYAKTVEVIRDGKTNGKGSMFYSLASKSNLPKVDYYGYFWREEQAIDMISFFTGGMEEFGGWFTSLNVQYLDGFGKWQPVLNTRIEPPLPTSEKVIYQPHFVEYLIDFSPVKTKAIRIIGDAKIQDHWHKYTKTVSGFTSITELSVYKTELVK